MTMVEDINSKIGYFSIRYHPQDEVEIRDVGGFYVGMMSLDDWNKVKDLLATTTDPYVFFNTIREYCNLGIISWAKSFEELCTNVEHILVEERGHKSINKNKINTNYMLIGDWLFIVEFDDYYVD